MATVVITGGSRGIGAAAVELFAAQGHRVYFLYEKQHQAAQAVALATGATAICCDVADGQAVREAFAQIGDVDILVLCASGQSKKKWNEFTKEDFILEIRKFISEKSAKEIQDSSLASDFECIINTYLSKHKTTEEEIDPENNISCPLAELNLISVAHKKNGITTYKKTSSSSSSRDE